MFEQNGVGYFLDQADGALNRYDISNEEWLSPTYLGGATGTPTAAHVDSEGIYVAYGSAVYRYNLDGTVQTHLLNAPSTVNAIHSDGNLLFINYSSGLYARFSSVDKTTNTIIDTFANYVNSVYGSSIATSENRIFGRSQGISPSDITYVAYNDDGTFVGGGDSPYHGTYPGASTTWVFPNGAKVVDSSGTVYATSGLTRLNSFGSSIGDIDFLGTDVPIILKGNTLTAYTSGILPTGSMTLSYTPSKIFVNDTNVITFTADAALATGFRADIVPLSQLNPATPDKPVDPVGLPFTPDKVELAADGTVLLYSKSHQSIFRWDPRSQHYGETIPLINTASFMAYSSQTNTVYLAYPSGLIRQIDLDASEPVEVPFVTLPGYSTGLATAGQYVFAVAYTYAPDGSLIDTAGNGYSAEYIWSDINQKMYFFRDGISPNDILWREINANGAAYPSEPLGGMGSSKESPYHPAFGITHPIRVAPDGSVVVLGSGRIYDAITLEYWPSTLANAITDAAWLGDELYTVRTIAGVAQFQQWKRPSYEMVKVVQVSGTAQSLISISDNRLLGITIDSTGIPVLTVLDENLVEVEPGPFATTTTIIAAPNPSEIGQSVTFTATVSANVPGTDTPTGTVTFLDGTMILGIETLSSGTATFTTAALATGNHSITAVYEGNVDFVGSTSAGVSLTVIDPPPTVAGTTPSIAGGTLTAGITTLSIAFSETVVGAGTVANFGIRGLGPDGLLGTSDDVLFPLAVSSSNAQATLSFAGLTPGTYRLTVLDNITDAFGNRLDGDADGQPGGNWVRDFVVVSPDTGLFAGPTSPANVSAAPRSIAVGDFNGDGIKDIVTGNLGSQNVSLFLGNAGGTFMPASAFASGGNSPGSIVAGDFNNDGKLDVAAANYWSANVGVLLNDGAGGFLPAMTFSSGGATLARVATGDFNGDGNLDLLVANYQNQNVGVLLGNGTGGFAAPVTYGVGFAQAIVVADFDSDGWQDFAVADIYSSDVRVYRGNGSGGFTAAGTYVVNGGGAYAITVGDFNGDNHLDLAVTELNKKAVGVLLNNGVGGFAAVANYACGGTEPFSATVGDFNGDGNLDLAVANQGNTTLGVLAGDGLGGFAATVVYQPGGSRPNFLAAADFNGDGKSDLAVANYASDTLGILLSTAADKLSAVVTYSCGPYPSSSPAVATYSSGGSYPSSAATADFNLDGMLDLAVANQSEGTVAVLCGDGTGGFAAPSTFSSGGSYLRALAVGDFNRDGKPDIAVSHQGGRVAVLLGDGALGFTTVGTYFQGSNPSGGASLAAADFNGDGNPDLVVASQGTGFVGLLLGDGLGGFTPVTTSASGGRSLAVGDFNTDGKPDIALTNGNTVRVLLGNGMGGFTAPTTYASGGAGAEPLAVGDFNADGNLDIAVGNCSSATVGVLPGNGSGGFGAAIVYPGGSSSQTCLTAADLNGDGRTDLIETNLSNVTIHLNTGVGGFAAMSSFSSGSNNPRSVVVGDFNGDGRPDLAVTTYNNIGVILGAPAVQHATLTLNSSNGTSFDVQTGFFGAGQLVTGTGDAFDGLNRLRVAGQDYVPQSQTNVLADGGRTVVTPTSVTAGLTVSREITVPNTGSEDFARTVDSFTNLTGAAITTTVTIVGNLGSDGATTVFATSDGDNIVEASDEWIGTDDSDGTGTPAIIHYIHGSGGLQPSSVAVVGDNIEWTYEITVLAGQTVSLGYFTVVASTRSDAVAAANALVTHSDFGGQAAAFLSISEQLSLQNFQFCPVADAGGPYTGTEGDTITFDASASTDPNSDALQYRWDFNSDGIWDTDWSTSSTATHAWSDQWSGTATVEVSDGVFTVSDMANVTVDNVAPTAATISGPIDGYSGVRGQERTFILTATDPSAVDQAAAFTFALDWGDGTQETVVRRSGENVSHVFTKAATYVVKIKAVADKDGGTTALSGVQQTLTIRATEMQGTALAVGGTVGDDTFAIIHGTSANTVLVSLNRVSRGTFSGVSSVLCFGQSGTDALQVFGTSGGDRFTVDGNSIVVNGIAVAGNSIESRLANGGVGNDAFTVSSSALSVPITIDGGAGTADVLIGPNASNLWQLTAYGAGTLNTAIAFKNIEYLTGGAQTDAFQIMPAGALYGRIDGNGGSDTLDYSAYLTAATVNLGTKTATAVGTIANIEQFVGSSATDTLIGANMTNNWLLTGANAGTLNNASFFSGFENLTGGSGADAFLLRASGAGPSGTLNGGSGTDRLFGFNDANLWTLTGLRSGNVNGLTFVGIENLTGGSGADSFVVQTTAGGFGAIDGGAGSCDVLIGPDAVNVWQLTAWGQGVLNGSMAFRNMENLTGGALADTFQLRATGAVHGRIDGGSGTNVLDYSYFGALGVTVNLQTGSATSIGGGAAGRLAGFRVVVGTMGTDTLIGDAGHNVLIGGSGADILQGGDGRDLLIGGTGADQLNGGAGEDIVVGCQCSYYPESTRTLNLTAIHAIMAEWTRTDLGDVSDPTGYLARYNHLIASSGGLNGSYLLNASTVQKDSAAIDSLFGGVDRDWFLADSDDLLPDRAASGDGVEELTLV